MRTDLPRWDAENGVISFDGSHLDVPAGRRMLLGNHEFYMVPMVRFEAIELMKLLEQVLEDPAVYLRLGHQWKLEGLLTHLRNMNFPQDMVTTTTSPILAVDD